MKKIVIFIFTLALFSSNIELDINNLLKRSEKNPRDIKTLNLIGVYFYNKKDYENAKRYFLRAYILDKKNITAKNYLYKIEAKERLNNLFKKYNTKDPNILIEKLYNEQKYSDLIKIYKILNLKKLSKENILRLSRVLMWEGRYKESLRVLKLFSFDNLDYYEIAGYDYLYLGEYKKAKRFFEILFYATGDREYALKLLDIYLYLGEYEKVKKLLYSLKRRGVDVSRYEEKYLEYKNRVLNSLIKKYKENPTYENLLALFWRYYSENNKDKALSLLKDYVKKNPTNNKAKLFYAKVLTWEGKYKEAKDIIKTFKSNLKAKLLLGKIYAWNGDFKKAMPLFLEVYKNGEKEDRYEAKKMMAFIYFWDSKEKKAKSLFEDLLKENPKDEEIKESLMVLNKNYKPLIRKYEKLLIKDPNNLEYILKLADFYQAINNLDKAIFYNEKYLNIHPENIERYKILGELYLKKKNFYKAFGNLEYWAEIKNTKEAKLQLAKYYYWYGFNNEALKILDELLEKYPDFKEAIELKAKILKINPKFVLSRSAATIDDFFNNRAKKLLILADRAYFASFYKNAADYYEKYISIIPDDYKTREKYAYALEYSKEYAKAAGEFYHLFWMENSPTYKYHIAYNLQQIGELKKAKKIYQELLNEVPKELPQFLKIFLNNWKKSWMSMDIDKYYSFYDTKVFSKFWKLRKESIFKKSSFISVGIYDPLLIYHKNNIYKIKFFQVYASKIKKDKGYKTLTIKCKDKVCKIIKEEWKKSKYIPYDKKNSLEYYIKENLKYIDKKIKSDDFTKEKKENRLDVEILMKDFIKKRSKKNKNIDLAPGLKKKYDNNESKILNLSYLQKSKKKEILISEYKEKNYFENNEKSSLIFDNYLFLDINYFEDNQNISMFDYRVEYGHKFSNIFIGPLFGKYDIKQDNIKKRGYYYGLDMRKDDNRFFSLFYDKTLKSIGFDIMLFLFNYNINLSRKNLVFSRKTICSTNLFSNKIEFSQYKVLPKNRSLWYSLAYEKIKENSVLTPQFDYEFYNMQIKDIDTILSLNGWYQFNSKTSTCYYSPKKMDNNMFNIRFTKEIFDKSYIKAKLEAGYSFWDDSFLYGYGIWAYKKKRSFDYKIGCDFGNTSSTNLAKGYSSLECKFFIRKFW